LQLQLHLDTYYETLLLLVLSPLDENYKTEIVEELNSLGFEGDYIYTRYFSIVEQYYATFEQYRIESPATKILSNEDPLCVVLYHHILYKNPEWHTALDTFSDEVIKGEVTRAFQILTDSQEDPITVLESLELSPHSKWYIMLLLQKPREQLTLIIAAITENIPAFEKAKKKITNQLHPLLQRFNDIVEAKYNAWPLELAKQLNSNPTIIPTLANPLMVYTSVENVYYVGLLVEKIFKGPDGNLPLEDMPIYGKCFSDRSKIEILMCLKDNDLYGLEIANKIGLTPATVSHHMNTLATIGLVLIEKRDGKIYYRLSKAGIKRFTSTIEKLFL
jgi:Predicted transcriptional regulators